MEQKKKGRRVGPAIHRLNNMLNRNITSYVRMLGIDEVSVTNGWIIRYLYDNKDKDIFQKDIEKRFSIGRSTVTSTIQLLEKKGYVSRDAVESDARLKRVALTERGMELHQTMRKVGKELDERTLEGISDKELHTFFEVIDKIEKNLCVQQKDNREGRKQNDSYTCERNQRI